MTFICVTFQVQFQKIRHTNQQHAKNHRRRQFEGNFPLSRAARIRKLENNILIIRETQRNYLFRNGE